MCRCCQSCLEDIYWNCIEEKFCFDESIANFNADEDDFVSKNNFRIVSNGQPGEQNVAPICVQPLNGVNSTLMSGKIHEEDYRREIQTSVPILAPEIMAVFANSQIFQEHHLSRVNTKSYLPGVHSASMKNKLENDQEKLLFHLEGDNSDHNSTAQSEKKITFTISDNSPLDINKSPSIQKFSLLQDKIDEENEIGGSSDSSLSKKKNSNSTSISSIPDKNEVILRPRLRTNDDQINDLRKNAIEKSTLRNVNSLPYFSVRPVASENDIFSISGTGNTFNQLSMTPDVPSISYSALPKNYEDTPTIEKYKESVSLFSIQAANQAQADNKIIDYSAPRYFRITQSVENVQSTASGIKSNYSSRDNINQNIKRPEKSKRLKNLRDSLPPLLIHRKRDESKQVH